MELWGPKAPRRFFSDAHWREPTKWEREAAAAKQRRRVFCASMADVFECRRDLDAPRSRLWPLIEATPHLDWLLLTKRPENIEGMVPWDAVWPRNVWIGTTAENQRWADKRVAILARIPAAVRFISAEPLLGYLNLTQWLAPRDSSLGVNWVIAGGESGSNARPMNPQWAESLRDQCINAGTAFHFKQWGHWGPEVQRPPRNARTIQFVDAQGRSVTLIRAGKRATGRYLDGRTWDGFPTPKAA